MTPETDNILSDAETEALVTQINADASLVADAAPAAQEPQPAPAVTPAPTATAPAKPDVDFAKVEALRKHMLMTVGNMVEVLDVSRPTYYGWVAGKTIRKSNVARVKVKLRALLAILVAGWPQPEIIAMTPKERQARLLELLGQPN